MTANILNMTSVIAVRIQKFLNLDAGGDAGTSRLLVPDFAACFFEPDGCRSSGDCEAGEHGGDSFIFELLSWLDLYHLEYKKEPNDRREGGGWDCCGDEAADEALLLLEGVIFRKDILGNLELPFLFCIVVRQSKQCMKMPILEMLLLMLMLMMLRCSG